MSWWRENKERALFAVSSVLLVAGGVAWLLDADTTANVLWIAGTVLGLVFSIGWTVASIRGGQLSVLLQDTIRPDAPRMVRALRESGITRVVLVTDKFAAIERESAHGATIMVGDGVNDAPALAAAGVGVALAARGATASSEADDIVLTVDMVDAMADAILIARRSKRIAMQAVLIGMGLSFVAMAAAVGVLPPAAGAVVQEVIDVLAIGIALRAVLP